MKGSRKDTHTKSTKRKEKVFIYRNVLFKCSDAYLILNYQTSRRSAYMAGRYWGAINSCEGMFP